MTSKSMLFFLFFQVLCFLQCCLCSPAIGEKSGKVMCQYKSEEEVICDNKTFTAESLDDPTSTIFYIHFAVSVILVLFAGVMSGLTIGLLSFDSTMLTVLKNGGEPKERIYAAGILPLVEKKHFLLVTLLLCNAAAMEALPLFLNKMVPEYLAIIISVTAVLFFGEIIPQAICSRFGLAIGYYLNWPVKALMFILSPLAWPISILLDVILGKEEGQYFTRSELKELVYLHGMPDNDEEPLTRDEITIVRGVLDMATKKVSCCFTLMANVFSLNADDTLSQDKIQEVFEHGHSRIPIFEESTQSIIGVLYVKTLIMMERNFAKKSEEEKISGPPVIEMMKTSLLYVKDDLGLYDLLNQFQEGRSHMAVVTSHESGKTLGIITLEDVIEELINEEIVDETDVYVDVQKKVHVVRPNMVCGSRPGLMNLAKIKTKKSNGLRGTTSSAEGSTGHSSRGHSRNASENAPLLPKA